MLKLCNELDNGFKENILDKPINLNIDKTNKKVLSILGSRFSSLNNQVFINKVGEKLICKFIDKKNLGKRLSLEGVDGNEKASLQFSYMDGYFYLETLNAYDHGKGNGGILLDIFMKKVRGKKVFLQDNAYIRNGMSDTYLRLTNFYKKRGFRDSNIDNLINNNVLFKGKGNEGKIFYKYYKEDNIIE